MGFSPQQVDAMSLWQFMACVDVWNASHETSAAPPPMTAEEFHEMNERLG